MILTLLKYGSVGGLLLIGIIFLCITAKDYKDKRINPFEPMIAMNSFLLGGVVLTRNNLSICRYFAWGALAILLITMLLCITAPANLDVLDEKKDYQGSVEILTILSVLVLGVCFGLQALCLKFLCYTIGMFLIVYLLYAVKNHKKKGWNNQTFLIEFFLACAVILATFNGTAGVRQTGEWQKRIVDMKVGSRTGHYVVTDDGEDYYVTSSKWKDYHIGGEITIKEYKGILGFDWIEKE